MQSKSTDKCVHNYNTEILKLFDPKLQLINSKPKIKNKLKEVLSERKNFKVQAILVLEHKKRIDRKIVHLSGKLYLLVIQLSMKHLYQCIKAL